MSARLARKQRKQHRKTLRAMIEAARTDAAQRAIHQLSPPSNEWVPLEVQSLGHVAVTPLTTRSIALRRKLAAP